MDTTLIAIEILVMICIMLDIGVTVKSWTMGYLKRSNLWPGLALGTPSTVIQVGIWGWAWYFSPTLLVAVLVAGVMVRLAALWGMNAFFWQQS